MSEENKITEKKCICQNEYFKKCSCIALGTFVGGFCALSLFAALNKPPVFLPAPGMHHAHHHMKMMHGGYGKGMHKDCMKKEMMKKRFEKRAEFQKKLEEKKMENKD